MKLTRKQELLLIDYAIKKLLEQITPVVNEPKVSKKRKWTAAQHKKFSESMRKKWAERKHAAQKTK